MVVKNNNTRVLADWRSPIVLGTKIGAMNVEEIIVMYCRNFSALKEILGLRG